MSSMGSLKPYEIDYLLSYMGILSMSPSLIVFRMSPSLIVFLTYFFMNILQLLIYLSEVISDLD